MSTPAAAALNGPGGGAGGAGSGAGGSGPAGGAGGVPGGAGGAGAGSSGGGANPGAGAAPAANDGFWKDWFKPDAPEATDNVAWLKNKNFPDPAAFTKSARELETRVATLNAAANLKGYPADKVNPDGTITKADENQVKAWRTTMGVPETADKYELPPTKNDDPTLTGYLKEAMLKAGVPASMAPALKRGYDEAVTRMIAEVQAQENQQSQMALEQLKTDWGSSYQERMALAGRGKEWIASQVGGLNDNQMRTLEAVLGTPKFLTMMSKIGASNGEGRYAGDNNNGGRFGSGPAEAQARLDAVQAERSSGKMTQSQWDKFMKEEFPGLQARIASGMAPQA